jgi:hypothetical protein
LYRLNVSDTFDGILNIVSSIYIEKTLHVSVYLKRVNIPANDLSWILPSSLKLNRWSQLENLLVAYKNCESEISKEKQFNAYTACPRIGAIPMNSRIVITKEIQICKKKMFRLQALES